jgi:hypothetical protein
VTAYVLAPLVLQFKLNGALMKSALEGLTPADLWRRPSDDTNPILWIFGHVVAARAAVAAMLGDRVDTGWDTKFARGAALLPPDRYPPVEEIERVNRDVVERLKNTFAALTDADLAAPATATHLPGVKTLADQIAFYAFHESYHVGQMAYISKSLGHSRIAG